MKEMVGETPKTEYLTGLGGGQEKIVKNDGKSESGSQGGGREKRQ